MSAANLTDERDRIYVSWAAADDGSAVTQTVWRGGQCLEVRNMRIETALSYAENIAGVARMALTRRRRAEEAAAAVAGQPAGG